VSDPKQPETMTPNQLRALADRFEREAAALTTRAKQLRGAADTIEAIRAMGPLTTDTDSTTLQDVNANTSSKLARGMSRSRAKRHPFVKALYEKKRITVTEWAKRHGLKPGTVASWTVKPGEGGARRIPREYADKIQEELGVPATLETWKSGIIEPE
jgi:hypothetical protein